MVSKVLADATTEAWEAPLYAALLEACPKVAWWLFRPELSEIARAWLAEVVEDHLTPHQASALCYRFGLTTGRYERWSWIAEAVGGVDEQAARTNAARGLVNLWLALKVRPKGDREALVAEARQVLAWAPLRGRRYVSLDFAYRHLFMDLTSEEPHRLVHRGSGRHKGWRRSKNRRRNTLWNPEWAKRDRTVEPRDLLPWLRDS